jgi:hypothetical protein
MKLSQNGLSSKMSLVFCQVKAGKILKPSLTNWQNAGIFQPGGCLTLNISELPNDAKECLLLDVLEKCVHPKYYLSKEAVQGMIRRSKKWGRGGYVFLQEAGKGKTQLLTLMSLQQLVQALTPTQIMEHTLSQKKSELPLVCQLMKQQGALNQKEELDILSPKQLGQLQEEILPLYGKTLILRKLTPTEKEKLQGFPENWTLVEE